MIVNLCCRVLRFKWLVQHFQSDSLRVWSWRSATFHVGQCNRRQSLSVWPPTSDKIPLPLCLPTAQVLKLQLLHSKVTKVERWWASTKLSPIGFERTCEYFMIAFSLLFRRMQDPTLETGIQPRLFLKRFGAERQKQVEQEAENNPSSRKSSTRWKRLTDLTFVWTCNSLPMVIFRVQVVARYFYFSPAFCCWDNKYDLKSCIMLTTRRLRPVAMHELKIVCKIPCPIQTVS